MPVVERSVVCSSDLVYYRPPIAKQLTALWWTHIGDPWRKSAETKLPAVEHVAGVVMATHYEESRGQ